jgi:hypothetical protein
LFELEKALRNAQASIRDLTARVARVEQLPYNASSSGSGPGGGGGGAYKCVSAAGTPAGGTSTETILQFTAGAFNSIGTATITNPMPSDAIPTGHTVTLAPDGSGNYMAVSVSCT